MILPPSRLRRRQFIGVERPQRVVLVAPPDSDPHNLHSSLSCFVEQAGGVSAAEQFAEEYENVALTEDRVFGKTIQCNRIFHAVSSLISVSSNNGSYEFCKDMTALAPNGNSFSVTVHFKT